MEVEIPTQLSDGSSIDCFHASGTDQFTGVHFGSSVNNTLYQIFYYYDGKLFPTRLVSGPQYYAITYRSVCLNQGDLVYKPEYKEVWFPLASLAVFIFILMLVYKIIIKRLLP